MASPQKEDGFAQISCELLGAILWSGLKDYENGVMSLVLNQIYGPSKTETAFLEPGSMSGAVGLDPKNFRRAVKGLVERGMLEPSGGAWEFRFREDWDRWKSGSDGKPTGARFGGKLGRFLTNGVLTLAWRGRAPRKAAATGPAIAHSTRPDSGEPSQESTSTPSQVAAGPNPEKPGATRTIPACPADADGYWSQPGAHEHTAEQVRELWGFALAHFPEGTNGQVARQIIEHSRYHSLDTWKAAISEGKASKPGLNSHSAWRYLHAIATGKENEAATGGSVPHADQPRRRTAREQREEECKAAAERLKQSLKAAKTREAG